MWNFNPRSPRGGATLSARWTARGAQDFNPRSPRGGATWYSNHRPMSQKSFQSTLPTRGSDYNLREIAQHGSDISIHAPHEGERQPPKPVPLPYPLISIHAPHEGERPMRSIWHAWDNGFQSTLPTRGSDATGVTRTQGTFKFQSTLPTRGSDTALPCYIAEVRISIHAPHEGERRLTLTGQAGTTYFNPRSPRGGATHITRR